MRSSSFLAAQAPHRLPPARHHPQALAARARPQVVRLLRAQVRRAAVPPHLAQAALPVALKVAAVAARWVGGT